MAEHVTDQEITLTAAAAEAVRRIMEEERLEGYALRVFAAGEGCCGVRFSMALDNNLRANDATYEAYGVRLVVDEVSRGSLSGAKIDFVHDAERGSGFIIQGPHTQTCSHEQEEIECACGTSCGCRG